MSGGAGDLQSPKGAQIASADLAARYSAEEIPKQGEHARHKERVILYAGTGVSVLGAVLGLWFALPPRALPRSEPWLLAGWGSFSARQRKFGVISNG